MVGADHKGETIYSTRSQKNGPMPTTEQPRKFTDGQKRFLRVAFVAPTSAAVIGHDNSHKTERVHDSGQSRFVWFCT